MSIAGGVDNAFDRGERVGCQAMQIFTKSNSQWRARPLREKEIARYHARQAETGITPVVAHASYLLNLGTPDDALWEKSLGSLLVEMERCDVLGDSLPRSFTPARTLGPAPTRRSGAWPRR